MSSKRFQRKCLQVPNGYVNGIPSIVPNDLFERVQKKLEINKKAPARHKAEDDYLLTTKIFCGYCGAYLCGESGTGRNDVYHYYKCVSVKKKRTECECKPVRKVWIENLVLDSIMEMLADDRTIRSTTTASCNALCITA